MMQKKEDAIILCEEMKRLILINDPQWKPPEWFTIFSGWGKVAVQLLNKDQRPFGEAMRVINWALNDGFWKTVILDMVSFRNHYTKLKLKMEADSKSKSYMASSDAAEIAWFTFIQDVKKGKLRDTLISYDKKTYRIIHEIFGGVPGIARWRDSDIPVKKKRFISLYVLEKEGYK